MERVDGGAARGGLYGGGAELVLEGLLAVGVGYKVGEAALFLVDFKVALLQKMSVICTLGT